MAHVVHSLPHNESLPARGVWIEILSWFTCSATSCSHSPQGECGLKYEVLGGELVGFGSLPARGVWIEIGAV